MDSLIEQILIGLFSAWVGGSAPAEALDPMRPPEPVADCHALLEGAGVSFKASRIPLHDAPGGHFQCGAPDVVRYTRGPGKLRWSSSPKLSCQMALGLARFETIVQEQAQLHLGRRVYRVKHIGTYNCREMAAYQGWVSEHSYANAIDIVEFELTNGSKISVLKHWDDPGNKGEFLRSTARRLFDENVFAGVLTPAFDDLHDNHWHLDMAHYRSDGAGN